MRFLSEDQTLNTIAEFLSAENAEIALAVAFWGGDGLKRLRTAEWKAKKVRVICDARSGACNPQALKDLKKQIGSNLRTNDRLHAKVYWTPCKVVIT
jgi:HKD family nuclease